MSQPHPSMPSMPSTPPALSLPEFISGPVSVHVFSNNIIILGDAHFSDENMCSPCLKSSGCETIDDMFHRFVDESNAHNRHLDVHIELPYVSPVSKNWQHRGSILDTLGYISRLNSPASAAAEPVAPDALHRAVSARRLGMLGRLYHNFKDYLYDDDSKSDPADDSKSERHVRFHYIDIRMEPNIDALPQYMKTANDMHARLTSLIFGNYSDTDAALMPFLAYKQSLSTHTSRANVTRTVHKVTKQYLKLMDHPVATEMFPNVTAYLQDRIHELVEASRIQMQLSDRSIASDSSALGRDALFFITDAYLLCRALFYAAEHPGGTTAVYVGGQHAECIVTYMMHYEHQRPSLCHKLRRIKNNFNRCVPTKVYV